MKTTALFILLTLSLAAGITVNIGPNPAYVGETVSVSVTSDTAPPRIVALPLVSGLDWLRTSATANRTSGGAFIASYPIQALKAGTFEIPKLKVFQDSKLVQVAVPRLEVKDPDLPADAVLLEAEWGSDEREVFVGQALPLNIRLLMRQGLTISQSALEQQLIPELKIRNVAFRRFPDARKNRRFRIKNATATRNARPYRVIEFHTVVFPQKPGPLRVSASHRVPIYLKNGDDLMAIWNSGPKRLIWQRARAETPRLRVLPLPPPPEDALVVGLLGSFDLTMRAEPETRIVGKDVSLKLIARGVGNLEFAQGPPLSIPGFDVYEPLIEAGPEQVSIIWTIVPREQDASLPEFRFVTFSPQAREWVIRTLTPEFRAKPPPIRTQAVAPQIPPHPHTGIALNSVNPWRLGNPWLWLWLLGPVVYVTLLLLRRSIPSRRERELRRGLARLRERLQAASADDVPVILTEDVVDWLRQYFGLAPGAEFELVRQRLDDEQLRTILETARQQSYRSESADASRKQDVLRILSKMIMLALLLIPLGVLGASLAVTALTQYEDGDYEAAIESYQEAIRSGDAELKDLVDLGHAYYASNKLSHALLAYERAWRLAPRDTRLQEALQRCRMRLGIRRTKPFLSRYRDFLTPAEWFALAVLLWTLSLAVRVLHLFRPRPRLLRVAIAGLVAALLCVVLSWTQVKHTWSPRLGLVTENTVLHRLPDEPGTSRTPVHRNDFVQILETRHAWRRVRVGDREGWVPASHAGHVTLPVGSNWSKF